MQAQSAATWTAMNLILEPLALTLSVEAAKSIVALQIPETLETLIRELEDRAKKKPLSEKEQAEYRGYVMGIEILCHLKVKARRVLESGSSG